MTLLTSAVASAHNGTDWLGIVLVAALFGVQILLRRRRASGRANFGGRGPTDGPSAS